jgi:hypothetical protein
VLRIEKCLTAQMHSIFSKEINEINKVSCVEIGSKHYVNYFTKVLPTLERREKKKRELCPFSCLYHNCMMYIMIRIISGFSVLRILVCLEKIKKVQFLYNLAAV